MLLHEVRGSAEDPDVGTGSSLGASIMGEKDLIISDHFFLICLFLKESW